MAFQWDTTAPAKDGFKWHLQRETPQKGHTPFSAGNLPFSHESLTHAEFYTK
jgi:hypothetical protein